MELVEEPIRLIITRIRIKLTIRSIRNIPQTIKTIKAVFETVFHGHTYIPNHKTGHKNIKPKFPSLNTGHQIIKEMDIEAKTFRNIIIYF